MDAWSDEGRLYVLDTVEREAWDAPEPEPARCELSSRMVLIDATTALLERGRQEAAQVLFSCDLELEVGDGAAYATVPVWVKIKAPPQLVFQLQDFDRELAWYAREALAEALPRGYEIVEVTVQAAAGRSCVGSGSAAA
jgi:hypothetical protein